MHLVAFLGEQFFFVVSSFTSEVDSRYYSSCSGGVAEWLNAPVLKTGEG